MIAMYVHAEGAPAHSVADVDQPVAEKPIDHEEVRRALARIRSAVEAQRPPVDADVALAQRALGNARVSEILAGNDLPAAPGLSAAGEYKLVAYARHRFTNGPFDTGHAFIGFESPDVDTTFGFHPKQGGIRAMRPGGVPSVVKQDYDKVGKGVRMMEIAVSKDQYDKALAAAQGLAAAPPPYDLYRWNCVDFIVAVAAAADVSFPISRLAGIADPEGLADTIEDRSKHGQPEPESATN
jgi:hypothetical protein